MREFIVEVANEENWEHRHRVIKVEAETINQALKLASQQMKEDEDVYQVATAIEDCSLPQPVWDFFNQNMSANYGLEL